MTSYTPSGDNQNGIFVGTLNGDTISVTNDVNSYNFLQLQAVANVPQGQTWLAFTDIDSPAVNYTINNPFGLIPPLPPNFYQNSQVWELGNSLASIAAWYTVAPLPTVANEPAVSFCAAIPGCKGP